MTNGSVGEIQEPGSSREIINAGSYGVRVRKRALSARLRDTADHCDRVLGAGCPRRSPDIVMEALLSKPTWASPGSCHRYIELLVSQL
jgi:hypothetical protein